MERLHAKPNTNYKQLPEPNMTPEQDQLFQKAQQSLNAAKYLHSP